MRAPLHQLAHARAGDKGDSLMISVVAYRLEDYPLLARELTAQTVADFFSELKPTAVERFEAPGLGALTFVLLGALGGCVTRSLALDAHGKTASSSLLGLELNLPDRSSVGA
jgi:hypothetical protein